MSNRMVNWAKAELLQLGAAVSLVATEHLRPSRGAERRGERKRTTTRRSLLPAVSWINSCMLAVMYTKIID